MSKGGRWPIGGGGNPVAPPSGGPARLGARAGGYPAAARGPPRWPRVGASLNSEATWVAQVDPLQQNGHEQGGNSFRKTIGMVDWGWV